MSDGLVLSSVQNAAMFTALLPMIFAYVGPLTVLSSSLCHDHVSVVVSVCVCVCVLDAVVLSVQDAATFTALVPMICVSVGPLSVSV